MEGTLPDERINEFPLRIWELVCLSVISAVGVCGNIAVIAVVYLSKDYRKTPFNIYLAGLAAADFLVTLLGPMYYIFLTAILPPKSHLIGTVRCKVVAFFMADVLIIWSCYMLVVISFERYLAILYPIYTRTHSSTTKAYFVTALAYLLSVITILPDTFSGTYATSEFHLIGCYCTLKWKTQYIEQTVYLIQFFFQTAVPFGIFVFIFIEIWTHLTKQRRAFAKIYQDSLSSDAIRKISRRRGKSAKTIGIIIIVFFTCWMPNRILFFIFQYHHFKDIRWNSFPYQIGVVLIFLSSCLNPFIIAFRGREFREAFRTLISRFCPCFLPLVSPRASVRRLIFGSIPYSKLSEFPSTSRTLGLSGSSTPSQFAL